MYDFEATLNNMISVENNGRVLKQPARQLNVFSVDRAFGNKLGNTDWRVANVLLQCIGVAHAQGYQRAMSIRHFGFGGYILQQLAWRIGHQRLLFSGT